MATMLTGWKWIELFLQVVRIHQVVLYLEQHHKSGRALAFLELGPSQSPD